MIEKQEQRLSIREQMESEANALVMEIGIVEEPVHRRFDAGASLRRDDGLIRRKQHVAHRPRRLRESRRHRRRLALQRRMLPAEVVVEERAAGALPPLLALRTVTVRLPEYVVRALELIAADGRQTVDDVLSYELVELAGAVADEMGPRIPGFRQAYLFPGQERRRFR